MAKILINVALSDLPRDLIKSVTMKDGSTKKFINLVVNERKSPDQHGNDYAVSVYVPKDKRKEGDKTIYVGSGKSIEYKQGTQSSPVQHSDDADDMPF